MVPFPTENIGKTKKKSWGTTDGFRRRNKVVDTEKLCELKDSRGEKTKKPGWTAPSFGHEDSLREEKRGQR